VPAFTIVKTLSQLICTAILAMLAWHSWQAPVSEQTSSSSIRIALPHQVTKALSATQQAQQTRLNSGKKETPMWRVITRRVITKAARTGLKRRLIHMHLKPITIQRSEKITMHAFDDAELFSSRKQANHAARFWQDHNISTNVIKAREGVYLLGLGRFYQIAYATEIQQQLIKTGRKFRYQKRTVPIPSWRFTFAPESKKASEKLWRRLNASGVIMPVMMPEDRFQASYGAFESSP